MKRRFQIPPIISASEKGDLAAIQHFLHEHPESVNEASALGTTALHAAAAQKQKEACELLLENGARVGERCKQGKTPLHFAAAAGSVAIAQMLIDHGADVTLRDKRGQTPLDVAIGHEELGRPETAEMVRLLNRKDQPTMQTLKTAIAEGDAVVVQSILEADPTAVSKCDDPGDLLLQAVIHYEEAGTTAIIKLLLDNGIHPNTKSKSWPELPILYARTPEVLELLLAAGANPNASNSEGMTPLKKARKYKMKQLEEVLLRYGAGASAGKTAKSKGKPAKPSQGSNTARKKDPERDS